LNIMRQQLCEWYGDASCKRGMQRQALSGLVCPVAVVASCAPGLAPVVAPLHQRSHAARRDAVLSPLAKRCAQPLPAEPLDISRHGRMLRFLASSHPREAIGTPFLTPDPVVDEEETAGIILPLHRG
jgi:hypothetical protein